MNLAAIQRDFNEWIFAARSGKMDSESVSRKMSQTQTQVLDLMQDYRVDAGLRDFIRCQEMRFMCSDWEPGLNLKEILKNLQDLVRCSVEELVGEPLEKSPFLKLQQIRCQYKYKAGRLKLQPQSLLYTDKTREHTLVDVNGNPWDKSRHVEYYADVFPYLGSVSRAGYVAYDTLDKSYDFIRNLSSKHKIRLPMGEFSIAKAAYDHGNPHFYLRKKGDNSPLMYNVIDMDVGSQVSFDLAHNVAKKLLDISLREGMFFHIQVTAHGFHFINQINGKYTAEDMLIFNNYLTQELNIHFDGLLTNRITSRASRQNKITLDPSPLNKDDSVLAMPYSLSHRDGVVCARLPITYEEMFTPTTNPRQISTRFAADKSYRRHRLQMEGIVAIPVVDVLSIRKWST